MGTNRGPLSSFPWAVVDRALIAFPTLRGPESLASGCVPTAASPPATFTRQERPTRDPDWLEYMATPSPLLGEQGWISASRRHSAHLFPGSAGSPEDMQLSGIYGWLNRGNYGFDAAHTVRRAILSFLFSSFLFVCFWWLSDPVVLGNAVFR